MIVTFLNTVGSATLSVGAWVGRFALFTWHTGKTLCTTKPRLREIVLQMHHIGVESLSIVVLSGTFTGLALALQIYIGFQRFGTQDFIGTVVTQAMIRELGPVLTGLMIIGRAGSAMAAQLGTMSITEQIDALRTLAIHPIRYLVVPRIIASTLIVPCMTLFSMLSGIIGGYFFCTYVMHLNPDMYITSATQFTELSDITGALIKSAFFGFIMALVACYYGYHTTGGARGVGKSTTQSVVVGSVALLIANYFLSALLFELGM